MLGHVACCDISVPSQVGLVLPRDAKSKEPTGLKEAAETKGT